MVKKLALITSLFFSTSETTTSHQCRLSSSSASMSGAASFSTAASWQWPSCTQARTRSFRGDRSPEIVSMRHDDAAAHIIIKQQDEDGEGEEYHPIHNYSKTCMNPAFGLDSYSSSRSLSASLRAAPDEELIIHGLRSDNTCRLFFEPESTSAIVGVDRRRRRRAPAAAFGGATALAIESADPYGDFRRSMEEMVLSHGVDDWGWLEEMLGWYLRANGKRTHGLIVGAFVDLLASSAPAPAAAAASTTTSLIKCSQSQSHSHLRIATS